MPIFANGRVHRICVLPTGQIEWRLLTTGVTDDLVVTFSPIEAIQVATALLADAVYHAHPTAPEGADERNGHG
jgi:hypothetical protein